jgi:hypothetical protein
MGKTKTSDMTDSILKQGSPADNEDEVPGLMERAWTGGKKIGKSLAIAGIVLGSLWAAGSCINKRADEMEQEQRIASAAEVSRQTPAELANTGVFKTRHYNITANPRGEEIIGGVVAGADGRVMRITGGKVADDNIELEYQTSDGRKRKMTLSFDNQGRPDNAREYMWAGADKWNLLSSSKVDYEGRQTLKSSAFDERVFEAEQDIRFGNDLWKTAVEVINEDKRQGKEVGDRQIIKGLGLMEREYDKGITAYEDIIGGGDYTTLERTRAAIIGANTLWHLTHTQRTVSEQVGESSGRQLETRIRENTRRANRMLETADPDTVNQDPRLLMLYAGAHDRLENTHEAVKAYTRITRMGEGQDVTAEEMRYAREYIVRNALKE